MTTKIAILGGGAMATACAILLASRDDQQVSIWMRDAQFAAEVQQSRINSRLLPGIRIPDQVQITGNLEQALDQSEFLVLAIPSAFLRASLQQFAPYLNQNRPIISVIKGMEIQTLMRPSQIIDDVLGHRTVAVLAGPSHAEEIANKLPASVVVAGSDEDLAIQVQSMFNTDRFRVYTNRDITGVELAGALKNVIAIAAGICDGMKFGDNAKSALVTRGQVEMMRFGAHFGAEESTFYGLAGIGDLMTTCFSPFGRNRKVGQRLGQGESLDAILASMESVAEGVTSCRAIHQLALEKGINMPITSEIYNVLFDHKSPADATRSLMQRPLQSE
jgi:glycerol-3-phosphate dehydrogenase (NAD(P)+)